MGNQLAKTKVVLRLLRNSLTTKPDDLFLKAEGAPEWRQLRAKLTDIVR